jgi:hypothetical protein
MPSFQLVGLDPNPFTALFSLSDHQLSQQHARRVTASEQPGFPCRISLEDARVGEELLLLPYQHQPADSPYRASGPIYIRRGVSRRRLPLGEVNEYVTRRLISLRAYDREHMICGAEVIQGALLENTLDRLIKEPQIAYIHLHNAKHGCFFCEVQRVDVDTSR